MTDGLSKYKYVIELDFTNLDDVQHVEDVENLQCELFEDVSVVLSRLVQKYGSLVGFKQDLEESTLSRGETE